MMLISYNLQAFAGVAGNDGRRGVAIVGRFGGDLSGDLYSARRHTATGTTTT